MASTVGELIEELKAFPPDYRFCRSDDQGEFDGEVEIDLDVAAEDDVDFNGYVIVETSENCQPLL